MYVKCYTARKMNIQWCFRLSWTKPEDLECFQEPCKLASLPGNWFQWIDPSWLTRPHDWKKKIKCTSSNAQFLPNHTELIEKKNIKMRKGVLNEHLNMSKSNCLWDEMKSLKYGLEWYIKRLILINNKLKMN